MSLSARLNNRCLDLWLSILKARFDHLFWMHIFVVINIRRTRTIWWVIFNCIGFLDSLFISFYEVMKHEYFILSICFLSGLSKSPRNRIICRYIYLVTAGWDYVYMPEVINISKTLDIPGELTLRVYSLFRSAGQSRARTKREKKEDFFLADTDGWVSELLKQT